METRPKTGESLFDEECPEASGRPRITLSVERFSESTLNTLDDSVRHFPSFFSVLSVGCEQRPVFSFKDPYRYPNRQRMFFNVSLKLVMTKV